MCQADRHGNAALRGSPASLMPPIGRPDEFSFFRWNVLPTLNRSDEIHFVFRSDGTILLSGVCSVSAGLGESGRRRLPKQTPDIHADTKIR